MLNFSNVIPLLNIVKFSTWLCDNPFQRIFTILIIFEIVTIPDAINVATHDFHHEFGTQSFRDSPEFDCLASLKLTCQHFRVTFTYNVYRFKFTEATPLIPIVMILIYPCLRFTGAPMLVPFSPDFRSTFRYPEMLES